MACEIAYEELAAYAGGDLETARSKEVERHVESCTSCRRRLEALRRLDALLAEAGCAQPPAKAVLAARRAVAHAIGRSQPREIMTLGEAAEFLRLTPAQLGEIVDELPAFELAGQVRVRRQRLIEWVQQRERDYTRQAGESWVARARFIAPEMGVA